MVFDWSCSEEFKLVAKRERDEIVKATMGERQKRENKRMQEKRRRRGEAEKILEGVEGVDAPQPGRWSTEEECQWLLPGSVWGEVERWSSRRKRTKKFGINSLEMDLQA